MSDEELVSLIVEDNLARLDTEWPAHCAAQIAKLRAGIVSPAPGDPFVVEREDIRPDLILITVSFAGHKFVKLARSADAVADAIAEAKKDLAELERLRAQRDALGSREFR